MDCSVTFETLVDYTDGRLAENEKAELLIHLESGCPSCRERLGWLSATLPRLADAFRASEPAPVPVLAESALARAARINRLLPADGRSNLSHQFAEAVKMPGAAPTLRGAAQPAIHRAYETPTHQVLVWDEPDDGATRYLIGQVYSRSGEVLEPNMVRLLDDRGEIHLAEREGSEFHLPAVPPGSCIISCELEQDCIIVPQVEVGRA